MNCVLYIVIRVVSGNSLLWKSKTYIAVKEIKCLSFACRLGT